ncbi:RNA polymerase sigma-70 factor, ECF subfamily [Mucilaginibacter gossypiicola]|uniref:RNA polymerase sigma-70 factor, ECF subfamily n=1 Tax=Mucilaginibacter gossypiicola TaxID=551995 RepID=A0A1H8LNA3_9SPHI|nr:sigma-70 family RNA polymerase sigma factor [Mucilaginibacter gossypiicola]SEO06605.1 RNA polymerase sigma-70 factor, ECF subfamily [Mucilaginibacter gossypiicola]
MLIHLDESELLKRLSEGDRRAFTTLYNRNINNLYRYIYLISKSAELTEEIVQCVFIKIWERRQSMEHIHSFQSYVYRSAKNLLLDHIKKTKAEAKVLVLAQPDSEESPETSDAAVNYKEFYMMAQDAINLLPEKRRRIVELRTREELSLDEIADRLSLSKSTVKNQLYAGMDFVRKYLQANGELTLGLLVAAAWWRI